MGSLKVKAPVSDAEIGDPKIEHLHAEPDPADINQAILTNTPPSSAT